MAYLRLNVSNLCNFSCKYCHVFKLTKNETPMKIMDYETIKYSIETFCNILKKYGENNLTLSIYGGEPLINKQNLFKAVKKYGNHWEDVHINWMVNTNGSLFDEEVADFFKKYGVDVHLSVDGFEETHNQNRTDKFGKKTFDKVEKALSLIKQKNVKAQINSFIFPENINNLSELVDLAKKFNIYRMYLDFFYDTKNRTILPSLFSNKYFETYKYGLENDVRIYGPWTQILIKHTKKEIKKQEKKYKTPAINITVDKKFFFNFAPIMEPLDIRCLNYDNFIDNYRGLYEQFRILVENNCKYCFLKKSCNGTMMTQFQYHTKMDKGWKRTCASTREVIKLIKNQPKT